MDPKGIEAAIGALKKDPVLHIRDIQGVDSLESYQTDICRSIAEHDRVVISACHSVGKTWTMAKIVLWLGSVYPGAKIITTAPTYTQVEKLLWSEIKTGHSRSKAPLGGKMLNTEWQIDDDWFAIGMSPKDDAGSGSNQGKGSNFQGFHGSLVVVIFDEATGVNPKRWIQAEGMMTSQNVKFIAIGNPTSRNTEFYRCFSDPQFKKIKISCFDSPNLIANGFKNLSHIRAELNHLKTLDDEKKLARLKSYKVVQPKLITLQWVMGRALRWGMGHPLFITKVLGEFPEDDENALIPLRAVELAQSIEGEDDKLTRAIGVDPARFGSDSTVITVIEGKRTVLRKELTKRDTAYITGEIVRLCNDYGVRKYESIAIDATGIGSGVVDQLREKQRERVIRDNIEIIEVHFGAKCQRSEDKENFQNLKAYMFNQLSYDLKDELSLPNEDIYLEELPAILYEFDSSGRYKIESKDDFKKRTGLGSPDSADSLALANYARNEITDITSFDSESFGLDDDVGGTIAGTMNNMNW